MHPLTMLQKYEQLLFTVGRIFIGFLFFQHGLQLLFGLFGGTAQPLLSLLGIAGVFEFFGGFLFAVGFFVRPVSFVLAIEMLVAYLMVHAPQGLIPVQNGGELSLLYFAIFLIFIAKGGGLWTVEQYLFHQEFY